MFAEIAVIALLLGGAVLLALWLAAALSTALLRFVPTSADATLGAASWSMLAPPGERCTDPAPRRYVESIAAPLLAALDDRRFEFRFEVVDRPEINAAALPGGYVVVHFELLQTIERGEELAGVLAHELFHVTERHGLARILRSAGGRVVLGLVFGWSDVSSLAHHGGSLASLAYDRDQERAADARGRALLMKAGIDPGGMAQFFRRLSNEHGDVPAALRFLTTHPGHEERVQAAERDAHRFRPSRRLPAPGALRCR